MVVDRLRALRTSGPDGRPAPEIMYGRRKMTDWLNKRLAAEAANAGLPAPAQVSKHTMDRLMRQEGFHGLVRSRGVRTTTPAKKDHRRAPDLLQRCFSAPRPNQAWVTDFT